MDRIIFIFMCLVLSGVGIYFLVENSTQNSNDWDNPHNQYASYDECVLENMKHSSSRRETRLIEESCKRLTRPFVFELSNEELKGITGTLSHNILRLQEGGRGIPVTIITTKNNTSKTITHLEVSIDGQIYRFETEIKPYHVKSENIDLLNPYSVDGGNVSWHYISAAGY